MDGMKGTLMLQESKPGSLLSEVSAHSLRACARVCVCVCVCTSMCVFSLSDAVEQAGTWCEIETPGRHFSGGWPWLPACNHWNSPLNGGKQSNEGEKGKRERREKTHTHTHTHSHGIVKLISGAKK